MWDTSCRDWESRLLNGSSLVPPLPLFEDEAARALRIFKRLRLPDVIGTPPIGEIGAEWWFAIVAALFGAYDPSVNERLIQELFLLVPKKNGKSTLAAGVMVVAIIINRRPEAEFNFLAPTIEVAGISFRQSRGIIKADPELAKVFHIQDNIRRITHRRTGSFLQIKAADTDVVTGGKPVGTLIDETHVFAKKPAAADIFTEIRGALAARPDGFLIQITTQSKAPPAGVFKAELDWAREVRDGKLSFPRPRLPVLYELPASLADQWKDETYWPLINPNIGRSVDIDFLRSGLIDAERKGRAELALFASQHFNVEIGLSLRSDRWAGADYWERRADPTITLDEILRRCEVIVVGLDGGGLDDLFGLCVLGREKIETEVEIEEIGPDGQKVRVKKKDKRWLAWNHAWCHPGVLERRKSIAAKLRDFEVAGDLTIVETPSDIFQIAAIIQRIKDAGLLHCVAVDPAGLGELVDVLDEMGITQENRETLEREFLIGVPQGYAMMNAIKTAERRLSNGSLLHAEQPLMDWAVGNVKIEPTATAIRATKQNAGDAKVDPAFALFDAATMMSRNPSSGRSTYEDNDLFVM